MGKTLVIAEPGCTHEGSYALLVKLIHTAADCGADVFKPQWTSNPERMCERRHIGHDHAQHGYYRKAYGWLQFPYEWHLDFRRICAERGMQYACSVFLPEDVAPIALVVDYLKISAFESGDLAMLAAYDAANAKPNVVYSVGGNGRAVWGGIAAELHVVQSYPAPLSALNLRCVPDGVHGYSDHSRHVMAGAVAVAREARIIETHYRLHECSPKNPDYAVAFNPKEFAQYIQNIRDAELMLGDGVKQIQDCEQWAVPYRVVS